MILKLKINSNKRKEKKKITAWIQKDKDFNKDIKQIFDFFKNNVKISEKRRFHKFYKVSSENPAIIMSLFSTIHDLIPEIYFTEDSMKNIESLNLI